MVNIWRRIAQKLRGIILLLFGLVAFRFHSGRDRKPPMFMIWGFSDVSMTPKTNHVYLWRHQDTPKNPRKTFKPFQTYSSGISQHFEKYVLFLVKTRATNADDPSNKILKILNMGSISIQMTIW